METHIKICNLHRILRSRVLRVSCDPISMIKNDSCEIEDFVETQFLSAAYGFYVTSSTLLSYRGMVYHCRNCIDGSTALLTGLIHFFSLFDFTCDDSL